MVTDITDGQTHPLAPFCVVRKLTKFSSVTYRIQRKLEEGRVKRRRVLCV